jgi:hypothetical protein
VDLKVDVNVSSATEAHAKSHLSLRGTQASILRKVLRNQDQSRQIYDVLAAALFAGSKVLAASAPDAETLTHPLTIDEEIDLGASIRREGTHLRLKFPNDAETAGTKLAERQTPLDMGALRTSKTEIIVHLGSGLRLTEKPAAVDVSDPCFRIRRTIEGEGSTVILKNELEQICTQVSVEDYPRYRANMEHARSLLDAAVVFDEASPGVTKAADTGRKTTKATIAKH